MVRLYFVSVAFKANQRCSSYRSFVFRLARHLSTSNLAGFYLCIALLRVYVPNKGKNDTLYLLKDQGPQKPIPPHIFGSTPPPPVPYWNSTERIVSHPWE